MRMIAAALLVVVLAAAAIGAYLLLRPPVETTSSVRPAVTIRCDGSLSATEESCRAFGDAVIEMGAPSTTFEMDDVARLLISRQMLGVGSSCEVAYTLQRFPDDPLWTAEMECLGP
jgi:hypothetical protein